MIDETSLHRIGRAFALVFGMPTPLVFFAPFSGPAR
jgi:hypothetical protein